MSAPGAISRPAAAPPAAPKPRARGWIHFYSALVAVAVGITLVIVAAVRVGPAAAVACAIYAVTVIGLFTVSATYHLHTWTSSRSRTMMRRADHSMIFLFIAGTYTPISVLALSGTTRVVVLAVVWGGALCGVALKVIWPHAPKALAVPIYLAVGWVAVFVLGDLLHRGGVAALVLILTGGALYTFGAICYATRKPDPWPATFGYHEVFHAAVSLAAICHCVAIWLLLFGAG